MNKEEMNKYAYKLMIKNNQEEAIKNLMLLDKLREENKEQEEYIEYWQKEYDKKCEVIDKAIEYIEDNNFYRVITYQEKDKGIVELDKNEILEILRGDSNE